MFGRRTPRWEHAAWRLGIGAGRDARRRQHGSIAFGPVLGEDAADEDAEELEKEVGSVATAASDGSVAYDMGCDYVGGPNGALVPESESSSSGDDGGEAPVLFGSQAEVPPTPHVARERRKRVLIEARARGLAAVVGMRETRQLVKDELVNPSFAL